MAAYGLLDGKSRELVPLKDVMVDGRITGYAVKLDATFTYFNNSTNPVEVLFKFPVEDSIAVVGLEAIINGVPIKGIIKEKEEARSAYSDAIASGGQAVLSEEKTKDIFSLSLGNLPPQGEAVVILKMAGELPHDSTNSNSVRFSLPAVLKERYTPAGSEDPLALVAPSLSNRTIVGFSSFTLVVDVINGISSITSPTHDIAMSPADNIINVSLPRGSIKEDVIIYVTHVEPYIPRAIVEGGVPNGNDFTKSSVVMLDFLPHFSSLSAACEFVILLDRSGSMSGRFIEQAKRTLILLLKSIPPDCYFNIIGFGTSYRLLFPNSISYNQQNLNKALEHVRSIVADLGGTELLPPLEYVFKQEPLLGLPRQVFVLTDGSVSNTSACIKIAKDNSHIGRVFTFGIGSGASSELVNGLARAGNGSAEFIQSDERMQPKVISSLKKALQPAVTDIQIQFDVPDSIKVIQSPVVIPAVFSDDHLIVYGIMSGAIDATIKCQAVLTGKMSVGAIRHVLEFYLKAEPTSSDSPSLVLHQLAAKGIINDYESAPSLDKKSYIVKLSIESGVLSKYTSYVAVNEDLNEPVQGALQLWDVAALRYQGGSSSENSLCSSCDEDEDSDDEMGFFGDGPSIVHRKVFSNSLMLRSYDGDEDDVELDRPHNSLKNEEHELKEVKKSAVKSSTNADNDTLGKLIDLQAAEGFWMFNQSLAAVFKKTLQDLEGHCPAGVSNNVWGTCIVLVYLEMKLSSYKDEWELIAFKSEAWLVNEIKASSGTTMATIKEAAEKIFTA